MSRGRCETKFRLDKWVLSAWLFVGGALLLLLLLPLLGDVAGTLGWPE